MFLQNNMINLKYVILLFVLFSTTVSGYTLKCYSCNKNFEYKQCEPEIEICDPEGCDWYCLLQKYYGDPSVDYYCVIYTYRANDTKDTGLYMYKGCQKFGDIVEQPNIEHSESCNEMLCNVGTKESLRW